MSAVPTPRSGGIQSVERAVAVLKLFGEAEPELGVTELARRLRLHKSTISRLMATLEA
ncbi:MAG: IclR family transcriptional regulator, partial [Chloroflexi bacterium]|nr:IclR family transcriptional regulator [Chloroflexota bacterium]